MQQTEELVSVILQWCSSEQHTVLQLKAAETLKQLAVAVLQSMSFVDDHTPPLDL
jgi:hypothetical protein